MGKKFISSFNLVECFRFKYSIAQSGGQLFLPELL